jgi:hypothetical protein
MAKPVIGEEEKQAVLEVLDSGFLAQGPRSPRPSHSLPRPTAPCSWVPNQSLWMWMNAHSILTRP